MKKILKSIGTHTLLCVLSFTSVGVIYAAWNDDVISGSALTADSWNNLVTQVEGITTGSGKFISGTDTDDAVFNTGNIGIGTSVPTDTLTVYSDQSRTAWFQSSTNSWTHFITTEDTASNTTIALGNPSQQWNIVNTSTDGDANENDFVISDPMAGGAVRFTIEDTTGNVGIGTTQPTRKLTVDGPGTDISSPNWWNNDQIHVRSTDDRPAVIGLSVDANGMHHRAGISAEDAGAGNHYGTLKLYTRGVDANPRMTITHNGNVGIGTTAPAGKLDVRGDLVVMDDGSNPYMLIGDDNTAVNGYGVVGWNSSSNSLQLATQPYSFGANGGQINLLTNGNVGIGTASPSQKLEVNGNTKSDMFYSESTSIAGIAANVWTNVSCLSTTNSHSSYEVSIYAGGDGNAYRMSQVDYVRSAYNSAFNESVTAAHYGNMPVFEYRILNNGQINNQLQVRVNASNVNYGFRCLSFYRTD